MGLSNVRRALVVDSNPWNRRQICDVLAKKGYEVSACDSLIEGRKFFRSHPIVVAGSTDEEADFAGFVDFLRESAGDQGGYLIRLASDVVGGAEEASSWAVDDVIGRASRSMCWRRSFRRRTSGSRGAVGTSAMIRSRSSPAARQGSGVAMLRSRRWSRSWRRIARESLRRQSGKPTLQLPSGGGRHYAVPSLTMILKPKRGPCPRRRRSTNTIC